MTQPQTAAPEERTVAITDLGESHAILRVLDGSAGRAMRESLLRHGQLTAVCAYLPPEVPRGLEVVDGFKRLSAARALGWTELRVRVLPVDAAAAKAAIRVLNPGRGLSGLEEAWLVRALYREDRLTQPAIGQLLGRDKSWVSRRLLLAEGLDEVVQVDVRLGLLAARTAEVLARLPRVNQRPAAEVVLRRGLTHHQTEGLVTGLLSRPATERETALDEALEHLPEIAGAVSGRRRHEEKTPAQWIAADVAALVRGCARLQARLLARPLAALGEPAAKLVGEGLAGLLPVLHALRRTVERQMEGDRHAAVDDAPRA